MLFEAVTCHGVTLVLIQANIQTMQQNIMRIASVARREIGRLDACSRQIGQTLKRGKKILSQDTLWEFFVLFGFRFILRGVSALHLR